MTKLISVVVTCYNHENYIEQCIRSIFHQTYRNIELIVLDDGSTDNSNEIIQEVLKDSPFVTKFESHENVGVVKNRNMGLSLINGDYLLFVDSDNYLDMDYIEQLYSKLIETNADIAYCDLFNPEKEEFYLKSREFDLTDFLNASFIDNCSLIRRSIIGDARYDEKLNRKKLEDYDFLLNLILNNGAKAAYQPNTKLNYRVFETGSISGRDSVRHHYEIYLEVLEKYLDKLPHEIYQAVSDNLMTLEDRLENLINHHNEVSEYVKELQRKHKQLRRKSQTQVTELKEARNEIQLIRSSLSYRIGNSLIQPIKISKVLLQNPRKIKEYLKAIKRKITKLRRRLISLKTYQLRHRRNSQRSALSFTGKRALVYVIFESENRLQEYKLRFLQALSPLMDEVIVVVNGSLRVEDVNNLKSYGQVLIRDNKGYDTAAFREGIFAFGKDKLKNYDQLFLVNDTNIGPMRDLSQVFHEMVDKQLDFWGISFGEEQEDVTKENPYGYIPKHLQSYFLVIEKLMLNDDAFYSYWTDLTDTDSRDKAIGRHETRFTKYFADLGYRFDAVVQEYEDSAMYIHPLRMLKAGSPLVKYTALKNYDEEQFLWQGLERESEIPDLLEYITDKTDYPVSILEEIINKFKAVPREQYILLIDGVENIIPQCTRYRVLNKAEQLRKHGFEVKVTNLSDFQLSMAQNASHIIIYRSPISPELLRLCHLAKDYGKPVFFDIDDLVFDTVYTDQLSYTQGLNPVEKGNYDAGVRNYGYMLENCDGAITSTNQLQEELKKYQSTVLLNRNLASDELISISSQFLKDYSQVSDVVKIGYFSGSISHNENFELIKPAIKQLLKKYSNVQLHIVGILDIPKDMKPFGNQIVTHDYVDWDKLPALISEVDINLAPLVDSIFNRAKSEIKWIEAALVKVPTVASKIGAFSDEVVDGETGLLATDDEWFDKLESLVLSLELRQKLAESAYRAVLENCTLSKKDEMVTYFEQN
ncbi:rhamnan synthesis F family protein [Streptococcus lactarius]|uniref:Glycosyl transferase n=1 Tax=Streptococcus lactarius TaxID=684066 RepID=A0A9X0WMH4_9STRE|nr:rhamnan synthesis F family protein [Streptococcus lactarius]MBK4778797.1 glycosyl transferase [Streptococcus lactarius]QUB39726.1 glycosyltransferase [Streptococcus lactarius]